MLRGTGFILVTALVLSADASAAIRRVGSQYNSINAAVAAANHGDIIKIGKGRWQETVGTTKRLSFVGVKGTIWDGTFSGNSYSQLGVTANDVTVRNIAFHNGITPILVNGINLTVKDCTFRGSQNGINVVGSGARISDNDFLGLTAHNFAILVTGADATISRNRLMDGSTCWISVNAMHLGTATVTGNRILNNDGHARIGVFNASAPTIGKNRIYGARSDSEVILVQDCNRAVVSGNRLSNLNYLVTHGIRVIGQEATVRNNTIELLINESGDIHAILVDGNLARVEDNRILNITCGENFGTFGVAVVGHQASIQNNRIEEISGGGDETIAIFADGNQALVEKNTIRRLHDAYTYPIKVNGNDARVRRNKILEWMYEYAINVNGDDYRIEDNLMKYGAYYAYGIFTNGGGSSPGAAVIRGNKIVFGGYEGLHHFGDNTRFERNSIKHLSNIGIRIHGDGNLLVKNNVSHTGEDSYSINGDLNRLVSCTARNSHRDGFDISNGTGNTLHKCAAIDCKAEGLDNTGTNTTVTRCTLKKSRIDYAGAGKGPGTIADDTGTTFQTGGPATQQEID